MTWQSPPSLSDHQLAQLRMLEDKINAILPPRYQGCFEDVPPRSMGSAKLKTGPDGQIAWDEIWTTFCHLALAGGPPHRGTLLEPVPAEQAAALARAAAKGRGGDRTRHRHDDRADHISPAQRPGWVGVRCQGADMAAWLVRAIVAENVIARRRDDALFLPAGPHFTVEKEIKNVVTSLAKTCHYLLDHLPPGCQPDGFGPATRRARLSGGDRGIAGRISFGRRASWSAGSGKSPDSTPS